jgi:hypothetical protein
MEDRVHWAICLGVERLLNQLQLMLKLPKPATASPPVPVDVAKEVPASINSTSSNNYMRADGQNTGNFITVWLYYGIFCCFSHATGAGTLYSKCSPKLCKH